jgi:tRNA G18 (ribose-2'-O)-methylase SpoU
VAGAEEHGVSPAVRRACATAVRIPGSAAVDSLNVGVAVGVALARWLVP